MEIFHPSSIKQNRDGTGNNRLIFPAISTFTIKITDVSMNEDSTVKYLARITTKDSSYNSYANLDLTESVARSLHDSDMQQWQAVIGACNELTSVTDWVFDSANHQIIYVSSDTDDDPTLPDLTSRVIYRRLGGYSTTCNRNYNVKNYESLRADALSCYISFGHSGSITYIREVDGMIDVRIDGSNGYDQALYQEIPNPAYDSNAQPPKNYVSFEQIAHKLISNTSSPDQAISLLAETYIETVASSIFSIEVAKQFVKLADLISQFKINKV